MDRPHSGLGLAGCLGGVGGAFLFGAHLLEFAQLRLVAAQVRLVDEHVDGAAADTAARALHQRAQFLVARFGRLQPRGDVRAAQKIELAGRDIGVAHGLREPGAPPECRREHHRPT